MKKFFTAVLLLGLFFLLPRKAQAFENFVVNGTTYSFPDVDDTDWGQNVTDWAQAITNNVLYKNGGNFFLTSDVVLGSTYGVRAVFIASTGTALPVATTGFLRLTAGSSIAWRASDNGQDLFLTIGSSNALYFNGVKLSTIPFSTIGWISSTFSLVNQATATLNSKMINGPISIYSNGAFIGNATTLNFTPGVSATMSGTTGTVTAASSGGGATLKIPYEMTVGTPGAVGVDAYVGSLEQFNLVLASFGATGLTYSTTGQGRILFTNGLYNLTGSTVPAGIKIVCQSTVNFTLSGTAQTVMTNYGTVGDQSGDPCYIDAGGQAFASQAYVAKSYSVNNLTFIGGQNQANLTLLTNPARYCFYCVIGSSLTRGNLWFKEFRTPSMDTTSEMGTLATIAFQSGINSKYFIKSSTYVPGAVGGSNFGRTFFSLAGSTNTDIVFDAESASTGFLSMTKNNIISRFSGYAGVRSEGGSPYAGDGCVFCINNYAESIGPSSGTVFENMIVQVYGGGDLQIFRAGANGATFKHPWNVNWTNVRINCNDFSIANTYTGIVIGSDARNSALTNVMVNGCGTGINNGGTNTKGTAYINGTQTTY